ncbi:MAG: stage V sporulation protein AC [Clostridia bacterium]|nr:stage V sporulation protein AC [Clostridia bacterium]
MRMNTADYKTYVDRFTKPSPIFKNCLWAFFIGGSICMLGEFFMSFYSALGFSSKECATLNCITLIFISVLLTAMHVYEKIAKHAGAGTLVPITGFANAVSSAAIEFQFEGFIFGVGAKLFSIAGPVITYGTASSVIAGLVYYFLGAL